MSLKDKLAQRAFDKKMGQLARLFPPGVRLTLIVRNPREEDTYSVFSNENDDLAYASIALRRYLGEDVDYPQKPIPRVTGLPAVVFHEPKVYDPHNPVGRLGLTRADLAKNIRPVKIIRVKPGGIKEYD
ncbi:hypothetical protein EBT16_06425 [bacterium]|nr:hypothetical protein [bacterium]